MLYRAVIVVACLLSFANVASADWVWDCYQRVREVKGSYADVYSICKTENWRQALAADVAYLNHRQAREREVRTMQRERRGNNWW